MVVVVVVGREKLFVVFEGDLELVAGASVMNGYSAVVIEGEDGEETGMRDLCGDSSRLSWAKLSRFCSCEPRVVWRSRWRMHKSWRTKER